MHTLRHLVAPAVLGLAISFAAVGCGNRAAGPAVVLRMEGTDPVAPQHNPGLARFAQRLADLSHGNVRVQIGIARSPRDPDKTGLHEPLDERTLIRHVARGQTDLAWVGTQAFDTAHVRAFDALDAPLLIDSYAIEAAVLRSDIPSRMLASTHKAGVTGLALLGGGLSRPVSVKRPLVSLADYRGLTWRDLPATGRDAAVRALGGRLDRVFHPWFMLPIGLKAGSIDALETTLDGLFFDLVPQTPTAYVTDNVRLWPDVSAVIANPRRLARLSERQRDWVREAAREAQAYSAAHIGGERAVVSDLCATGVRFAEAPAVTLAGLRGAFAPAYAQLERDSATRSYIRRIQQLKAKRAPAPPLSVPPACRANHPAPVGRGPGVTSTLPDGIYRVRLTADDLRSHYVSGLDVERYTGTETLTLAHGRWTLVQQGAFGRNVSSGVYTGTPLRTVWTRVKENGELIRPQFGRRFSLRFANGMLQIAGDASDVEDAWYSSHAWKRIG